MKRSTLIVITTGFIAFTATARCAQAQTASLSQSCVVVDQSASEPVNYESENLTALLKQLTVELRKLRLELLEQRLENQELKITQWERELEHVRANKQWLEDQDRAFGQSVPESDEQPSDSSLAETERAERTAARAEFVGSGRESLPTDQQTIAQREADLIERLEREKQRRQELLKRLKELMAQAGGITEELESPARTSRQLRRQ